ncbi:MAG: hypothetical protein IKO86_01745 [Prevotella sp.]|nr:hypothetical protein [Prevotella sp.]
MKKYLMTVMTAVALGGLFTGCTKEIEGGEGNSAAFDIVQNYENAFITRFGQPAENQTWGFGDVAGTRANNPGEDVPYTSDAINANANEWADATPGKTYGGWLVPDTLTDAQKALVKAYFQAVPNLKYDDPHWRHFFIQQVYKGHTDPPTTGNQELNTAAGGSTYTSDNMNYLTVGHNEDHINDFNTGTCTPKGVLDTGYTANDYNNHHHNDQISLMVNIDDTECFGYHNSGCSIQRNDKAALVHWTTIRTWAREQGIYTEDILNDKWDRSFMGFDFELLNKEDSYYKDNSGNPIYAKFSNGQLNSLQYVYYGDNNIMKRGTRPASTRSAKRAGTRDGEFSVNIWEGTDQFANTNRNISLSDEVKELLVAGNYLGVDVTAVPDFYVSQWYNGTYTNWGIKLVGGWGEENGGRLDNGNFTLNVNSTNVEIQLSESDAAILKRQGLVLWSTADPIIISRIYISNYSQANGGSSETGTETGTGTEAGTETGTETQSDDNYEIYDSEYLIVDGKQIPFLIENKNMYGGEKYLNGDEKLTDADMTITANGKQCFNMAKIKELVDDGYLPVWNSNLRTWVKWAGSDGYFSDWIVTLTQAKRDTTPPPPSGFVCRIVAEDLTVGEHSDFDFNDVVFDVINGGTTLRLRAAGGELPLYVAGQEVHDAFATKYSGITRTTLINTGWNGPVDYENYYVDIPSGGTYSTRALAESIPIVVHKNGQDITLKAERAKVASKIAVGSDYEWCSEREDIDKKFRKSDYTKLFQQYVIGNLGDDWESGTAWYQYRGK